MGASPHPPSFSGEVRLARLGREASRDALLCLSSHVNLEIAERARVEITPPHRHAKLARRVATLDEAAAKA